MKFQYLDHTSECKFQAYGASLEEAFSNAVLAMVNIVVPVESIKLQSAKELRLKSSRLDRLLYDFLDEVLFLMDTEGFLCGKLENVRIREADGFELWADLHGDSIKAYETKGDVKAITYNDMLIEEKDGRWMVRVVVDI